MLETAYIFSNLVLYQSGIKSKVTEARRFSSSYGHEEMVQETRLNLALKRTRVPRM